jgi:hypothetical protein
VIDRRPSTPPLLVDPLLLLLVDPLLLLLVDPLLLLLADPLLLLPLLVDPLLLLLADPLLLLLTDPLLLPLLVDPLLLLLLSDPLLLLLLLVAPLLLVDDPLLLDGPPSRGEKWATSRFSPATITSTVVAKLTAASVQPTKVAPLAGTAVTVTFAPVSWLYWPAGGLVEPFPTTLICSRDVEVALPSHATSARHRPMIPAGRSFISTPLDVPRAHIPHVGPRPTDNEAALVGSGHARPTPRPTRGLDRDAPCATCPPIARGRPVGATEPAYRVSTVIAQTFGRSGPVSTNSMTTCPLALAVVSNDRATALFMPPAASKMSNLVSTFAPLITTSKVR